MKNNLMDLVTDELKSRINSASTVAKSQFKNTRPYREEKDKVTGNIQDFLNLTPDQITELRDVYGDIPVDRYLDSMKGLLKKEGKNART